LSQINNYVTTTFRARGGNVIAQMGQWSQGMGRFGQQLNNASRMSERLNAQWRAIGTTIRYALAGSVIFGITGLINRYADIQRQLGLATAIGTTTGGRGFTNNEITKLGRNLRQAAIDSVTPLNQINDAAINLLSTVQNVPEDQVSPILTRIAQAATLAQISSEDATKAFTTMNVAFGRPSNLQNISRIAQEFFILTKQAPGGVSAGAQIVQQIPQLSTLVSAGKGTPADVFGFSLATLRGGLPPAQAGRGLAFLLQTLAFPNQQTTSSKTALASIGITPNFYNQHNIREAVLRVLQHARKLGLRGNLNKVVNMDEDTANELESSGASVQSLGLSGQGAVFLGSVFHRIHALRTALALLRQQNSGQLETDLNTMAQAEQDHVSDVNDLSKQWARFRKRANLQAAAISIQALGQQVIETFAPILNLGAAGISGLQHQAAGHPGATRAAVLGGAGLMAAMGMRRFLGLSGGLGHGVVGANALGAALSPGGVLGDSPQNPMYVIVVDQLFGRGRMPGTGGGGTPPGGVVATGGGAATAGRTARIGRRLLRVAGGIAVVGAVDQATGGHLTNFAGDVLFGDHGFGTKSAQEQKKYVEHVRRTSGNTIGIGAGTAGPGILIDPNLPQSIQDKLRRMNAQMGVGGQNRVVGHATVDVNMKHPDGTRTQKRVHVPLVNEGGRHPVYKGKAGG
jgi:hypothetical protein